MQGRGARLFGRDRAVRVVREFMERPEKGRGRVTRQAPILIFEGPCGSGKTALLDSLEDSLEGRVPYARVNFEAIGDVAVYEVLAALAFELNRQCGDYGRLGFPRFIVGRAIMEAPDLDSTNRARARAQVKALLDQYRNVAALRALIQRVAPPLQSILGVPQQIPVADFAGLVLDGLLASGRGGRKVVLGAGQDWYGHQDLGLGADPLDELVRLNARFRAYTVDDNRGMVDGLLLAAFLADLRDEFENGRAAKGQFAAAVLLDNADTPDGRHFLVELAQSRQARATGDGTVPLVFVATSRGLLTARVAQDARPYARPETAGYDDHLHRGLAAKWWYPIVLRNLDEGEVTTMLSALGLQGTPDRRIAAMIYQFTGGHPGSTRRLLEAIARQPDGPYDVSALLERKEDAGGGTVGERLLNDLLADHTRRQLGRLAIAAAARDQDESDRLVMPRGLLTPADAATLYTPDLWGGGDPPEPAVLQPVLRRLLLRHLARTDGQADWATVHERLRVAAQTEKDEVGELYHALALGEIPFVTRRLAERLRSLDGDAWLALLDAVVAAPREAGCQDEPADEAQVLAGWAKGEEDPVQSLAAVVAGLWLVTDPLTGAQRRDLHEDIAAGFDAVARFAPRRRQALRRRAGDHRTQSSLWN